MAANRNLRTTAALESPALRLLKRPDFLCEVARAARRNGLVGEGRNAIVTYIVGSSALTPKPLNAIFKGPSSSGKNFVVSRVLRLFPESAVHEITSSSNVAWNYSGTDFRNRIVYLQERNEAAGAVHPVRLLISEGKLIRNVTVSEGGQRVMKRFVAEGPIASISTTTRDRIEVDDETRHISLWVNDSPEQTRKILKSSVNPQQPLSEKELQVWQELHGIVAQRAALEVKLPGWFEIVANQVDNTQVAARRYFPAFIEATRVIAMLRSFQRSVSEDSISVKFVDFAIAASLFDSVFVESLNRSSNDALETAKIVRLVAGSQGGRAVSADQLAAYLSISRDRAYVKLRMAADAGTINRANTPEKGNSKLFLAAKMPKFIPDPEEVLAAIPNFKTVVKFIHPLTGTQVTLTARREGRL